MNTPDLATTLRHILEQRNLSLNELARLSGVSVATLSRILNEQSSPSIDNVLKIADALQISISQLVATENASVSTLPTQPASPFALTAVLRLPSANLSPEGAIALLRKAMRGSWVAASTDCYLSDAIPQADVTRVSKENDDFYEVEVSFPHDLLEAGSIAGLLAVVASALTGTGASLQDFHVPAVLLRTFNGPAFGIRGVRDTMNKHGRPLLSATLRPMYGLSPRQYGRAAYECLSGGVDFTADPTLLHHIPSNPWRERFRFVAEAVLAATNESNEYKSHAVNITAPTVDDMIERANWAKELELAMVLVDPSIIGWSATQSIANWCRQNEMLLCAMGSRILNNGHLTEQLQARLLRLAGCDIVSTGSPLRGTVENRRLVGGILSSLRDDELSKDVDAQRYTNQPMAGLNGSMPAIGGGHNPWHFPRLLDAVGNNAIIQCGGSVMGHPWGSAAGATANRTALEALIQARNEGQNLNVEGRHILQKAARYSQELKSALQHWSEGAFLFGVISGNGQPVEPNDAKIVQESTITPFRRPTEDIE